jgi:hypothetical protein
MARTGTATLPLHYGKSPRWLFQRMAALSREMLYLMVREFGHEELLKRLSDPFWFQALGCVLGFDWHSSGLTTTVTGALKEGIKGMEKELGVFIAGGKGAASRKTPEQIENHAGKGGVDPAPLVYASRMSAKVDSAAVQDGYQLYHHVFFFTDEGRWAVIQQGMNPDDRTARRYHWLSEALCDFVVEPHSAVCCDRKGRTLNMTARESEGVRDASAGIARSNPDKLIHELKVPLRHDVRLSDIRPDRLRSVLLKTYERQPEDFEGLLGIRGVGPKTIRSLSLLSELLYGKPPSCRDPARFSFAHGGKDGTPYPVDRKTYDRTIEVMRKAVSASKVGNREKVEVVRRLNTYFGEDT